MVELLPALCARCTGSLVEHAGEEGMEKPQVMDPPPPSGLETTDYRAIKLRCAGCGHVSKATFSEWEKAPVQYGPRMHAMESYLAVHLLLEMLAKRNVAMAAVRTELESEQVKALGRMRTIA